MQRLLSHIYAPDSTLLIHVDAKAPSALHALAARWAGLARHSYRTG